MKEVRQKDIKSRHPDNPDFYDEENHEWKMEKLTLDNLKSLRRKMFNFWKASFGTNDPDTGKLLDAYLKYDAEIKRRLKYINKSVDEDHGMGYSHNVSLPQDQNTMNRPTISPVKEIKELGYKFRDFKWLGNMAGFGVPTEVYYGSILLGIIESQPSGYIIVILKGPNKNISIPPTVNWNHFKTKNEAAHMLHILWKKSRQSKTDATDL